MTDHESNESLYPILLLGDSEVGKTCFLLRYCDNLFQENHLMTMGLDFKMKKVRIGSNQTITVKIWDTAGQERFKSLTRNFYKKVNGIVLLYDITKRKTFDNIHNWLMQIKEKATPEIQIILVGNKVDSSNTREVSFEEATKLAEKYSLPFIEASAKDNINIAETFVTLSENMVKIKQDAQNNGINLNQNNKGKKGCC